MKYLLLFVLLLPKLLFSQEFTLKGIITDNVTKEPVYGAKVILNDSLKMLSDYDGKYEFKNLTSGDYVMVVSMLTFKTEVFKIIIEDKNSNFDVFLGNSQELDEVRVIGNIVFDRNTPVAVTKISAKQITEELGSRDLPMILNATPGVYATQSGGGDGDARINVRGFDQRNIGVLIDGVPVNDMENGQVYWSNWFGLDAITSQMQVQRGLGATKLAMPSVGGTINIVTSGVGNAAKTSFRQEYGTGNFLRSSLAYNSGLSPKGYGITLAASYKQADGWVDGTNSEGIFLYAKIQRKIKNHLISLSGFMAPQQHGQRSFKQSVQYWDRSEAEKLGIAYDSTQISDRGIQYNQHWGYETDENGNRVVKNERLNYYNKPQVTLKDFWQVNEKWSISNLVYLSVGRGGGTRMNNTSAIQYDSTNQIDWDQMKKNNQVITFFGTEYPNVDGAYSPILYKANNILVSSVNNHFWVGYLPQFTYNFNKQVSFAGGLDFRYYKGTHYQEVTDLLGGDYYINNADKNSRTPMKFQGDKIALNNFNNHRDGLVSWSGAFAQMEITKGRWTGFVNVSGIVNGYKGIDYFRKKMLQVGDTVLRMGTNDTIQYNGETYTSQSEGIEYFQTEWKYLPGGTIKMGANYELTEYSSVFINLGYLSRTPQYSNVIDNNYNKFFEEIVNEKIQAIEAGYRFANKKFGINLNGYFTNWINKPFPFGVAIIDPNDPQENIYVNINGMDAVHLGMEIDLAYSINKKNSLEFMFSYGDWTWNSSEIITSEVLNYSFEFDAKGVHVGDAAQTSLSVSYRWEPFKGFYVKPQAQYFDRYYSDFSPFNLQGENAGRESWVMPAYGLVNIFAGYRLQGKKFDWLFNGSVINLLSNTYISDSSPLQGTNNAFDPSGAQVFYGQGLRFNLSVGIQF